MTHISVSASAVIMLTLAQLILESSAASENGTEVIHSNHPTSASQVNASVGSQETAKDSSGERTYTRLQAVALGKQLTKYEVSKKFGLILTPLIVTFGLVGNGLSGLVTFHKDTHISCYFYMGMLAVTDSMYLTIGFTYWVIHDVGIIDLSYDMHADICKVFWAIMTGSALSGTYIILAMTLDRLIAVKWPLKSLTWCTMRRARVTSCLVIIACLLVKLPYVWITKPAPRCVAFHVEKSPLILAYYWINSAISSYIPFTILLILNLLIIQTMRKRGKYFQSRESSGSRSQELTDQISVSQTVSANSLTAAAGLSEEAKEAKKARSEKSLTRMLLLITFSFLILNTPVYAFYLVYLFISPFSSPGAFADYFLVTQVTGKIFQINFAINFYLYCLGGSKFRKDFRKLFPNFCSK